MTGTSSDVAFADAYVKGVQGASTRTDAYDAALQERDGGAAGRPVRLRTSAARASSSRCSSATRPTRVSEGVSWALEGDINDFGISNMAAALAARARATPTATRYREEARVLPQPRAPTT